MAFCAEKRGLSALGPLPLVCSLCWHVSMVPFSFSFASTSYAAGAAARASAEQTHFNPEAVQFALALAVFIAEAESFADRCIEAFDA